MVGNNEAWIKAMGMATCESLSYRLKRRLGKFVARCSGDCSEERTCSRSRVGELQANDYCHVPTVEW